MKRAIAIILFFCLTGPVTISYFWLQYQKKEIRREVKHMLIDENMDQLAILEFTESEAQMSLKWTKPHEFEYNGEMYDVVESTSSNGKIVYRCWHDNEETQLNRKLKDLLAYALSGNPSRNKTVKQVSLFFKTLYCSDYSSIERVFPYKDIASLIDRKDCYSFFQFSPPVPPPELI